MSRANGRERTEEALPEIGNAPGFMVEAEIAVQRGAVSGIAVSADGTRLIVTHHGDDSVSVIDTGHGEVAHTVVDIDEPFAVAVSDNGSRAYVSTASTAYDSILAFDMDANQVVAAHPLRERLLDRGHLAQDAQVALAVAKAARDSPHGVVDLVHVLAEEARGADALDVAAGIRGLKAFGAHGRAILGAGAAGHTTPIWGHRPVAPEPALDAAGAEFGLVGGQLRRGPDELS